MSAVTVGIVGGGVSGISSLHRLVKKIIADEVLAKKCESIHLWDEESCTGGPAWSSVNSDVQLFNLPAGVASLEQHDFTGPFLQWCKGKGHEDMSFGSYPARSLFGEYCAEFLQSTQSLARSNDINLVVHTNCRVTDIEKVNEIDLKITWHDLSRDEKSEDTLIVNAALLCTGAATRENDALKHLREKEGYFPSPWPHPQISKNTSVAVIGSGLSGVDAVKQLRASGHSGKIILASRRGLLPTVKPHVYDPFIPLSICTREAVEAVVAEHGRGSLGLLDRFIELIKHEMISFCRGAAEDVAVTFDNFEACFESTIAEKPRDGVNELKKNLAQSRIGKRIAWQDCIIALSIKDVIRYMWSHLGEAEKQIYCTKYSTILSVYFNSMPVSSAEEMLSYFESGNCTLKGQLLEVRSCTNGGFRLEFGDDSCDIEVDHVINAVGFGKHFTDFPAMSTLHRNLCERGDIVKPYLFGGLCCDFDTCRLQANSVSHQHELPLFYAIGHTISGTKMLTSGITYCLNDGAAAVDDMVQQLTSSK